MEEIVITITGNGTTAGFTVPVRVLRRLREPDNANEIRNIIKAAFIKELKTHGAQRLPEILNDLISQIEDSN